MKCVYCGLMEYQISINIIIFNNILNSNFRQNWLKTRQNLNHPIVYIVINYTYN